MDNSVVNFNGNTIPCVKNGKEVFVAIKPICEALGLTPQRQYEQIKECDVLGQVYTEQYMVASDSKERKMLCLPLEFINGWLFTIKKTNTMSDATKQALSTYKLKCYKAMFQFFFGHLEQQLQKNEQEIRLLEDLSKANEQKVEVGKTIRDLKHKIGKLREDRLSGQLELDL